VLIGVFVMNRGSAGVGTVEWQSLETRRLDPLCQAHLSSISLRGDFEHAGQNFGSLDRGLRATHPIWMDSVGGKAKWVKEQTQTDTSEQVGAGGDSRRRARAGDGAGRGGRRGQGGGQSVRAAERRVRSAPGWSHRPRVAPWSACSPEPGWPPRTTSITTGPVSVHNK
jgi:hypothetical protein